MERGSKLAIKSFKLVQPKNGKPFYYLTVMENVHNPKIPYRQKWEPVYYEAYIFDTDIELECADFSLHNSEQKYNFKNIANPKKSLIRVLEFSFENRSIWENGQMVREGNKIKYKPVFYIKRFCFDNGNFVTEDTQIKHLQEQVEELKQQNKTMKSEITSLKAQRRAKTKQIASVRKERVKAEKELKSYKQENNIKDEYEYDMDNISFGEM